MTDRRSPSSHAEPELLLARANRPYELRIDRDGMPAWPVVSDAEIRELQSWAASCGLRARLVDSVAGSGTPLEERGVVCPLDDASIPAAELYAHVTRRRLRGATTTEAAPSVFCGLTASVTADLLDRAYEGGEEAPGFVIGFDGSSLRRRVLRHSVALLRSSACRIRNEYHAGIDFDLSTSNGWTVMGQAVDPVLVRGLLRETCDLLLLHAHGDGLDAALHPGLIACHASSRPAADTSSAPTCQATSVCYRKGRPVADLLKDGLFISPADFACRVLLFQTCRAVLFDRRSVDPRWGLLEAALDAPHLAVAITAWRHFYGQPAACQNLAGDIEEGVPMGLAVGRFNAAPENRLMFRKLMVLGDPAFRFAAGPRLRPSPTPPVPEHVIRRPWKSDADLVRRMVQMGTNPNERLVVEEAARRALGDGTQAVEPRLLLNFLVTRIHVQDYWFASAEVRPLPPERCWVCGSLVERFEGRLRDYDIDRRIVTSCPNCNFLTDCPTNFEFRVVPTDRGLQLARMPEEGRGWIGTWAVVPRVPLEHTSQAWPGGDSLERDVEFNQSLPGGSVEVCAAFCKDARFALTGFATHVPASGEWRGMRRLN